MLILNFNTSLWEYLDPSADNYGFSMAGGRLAAGFAVLVPEWLLSHKQKFLDREQINPYPPLSFMYLFVVSLGMRSLLSLSLPCSLSLIFCFSIPEDPSGFFF